MVWLLVLGGAAAVARGQELAGSAGSWLVRSRRLAGLGASGLGFLPVLLEGSVIWVPPRAPDSAAAGWGKPEVSPQKPQPWASATGPRFLSKVGSGALDSCLWVPSKTLGVGLDRGFGLSLGVCRGVSPHPRPQTSLSSAPLSAAPQCLQDEVLGASWLGFPPVHPVPPAATRGTSPSSGARLASASSPASLLLCPLPVAAASSRVSPGLGPATPRRQRCPGAPAESQPGAWGLPP